MLEKVTPEQVGISSASVQKYLGVLERAQLSIHSVVMLRHGKVFYESYWKPFHKDFLHRMYSVSKSFVAIAIGFLQQDGLIDLDAPVVSYLDGEITKNAYDNVKKQTIRDMLMMSTGCTEETKNWFPRKPEDRLKDYFDVNSAAYGGLTKMPGAIFDYDSPGSFVLGAIVEIITGKKLMDYLREKVLDKIGFSKEAHCMECPGGHSWGDSAVMCTTRDLAKMVLFMMNGGSWEGEQILNKDYVKTATANLIDTNICGHNIPASRGYGYKIWHLDGDAFFFNGMGSQYGIAIPEKDIVFAINADTQGHPNAPLIIIDRFFEEVAEAAAEGALAEDAAAYNELAAISEAHELFALPVGRSQNAASRISGKEYKMKENPMGITKMKFTFEGDEGKLEYTNAQGGKTIGFGMGKNVFGIFPQEGYSDTVATKYVPGNYYKCAASGSWTHENRLAVLVQVIDKYFGRLHMRVAFMGEDTIAVFMDKAAEDFMNEYEGYAEGTAE